MAVESSGRYLQESTAGDVESSSKSHGSLPALAMRSDVGERLEVDRLHASGGGLVYDYAKRNESIS
jgi:hypothetical protein